MQNMENDDSLNEIEGILNRRNEHAPSSVRSRRRKVALLAGLVTLIIVVFVATSVSFAAQSSEQKQSAVENASSTGQEGGQTSSSPEKDKNAIPQEVVSSGQGSTEDPEEDNSNPQEAVSSTGGDGGTSTSGEDNDIPQVASSELLLCDPNIQCRTDRWGHNQRLTVGESMCNGEWRFGVAILEEGLASLVWQDCNQKLTLLLANATASTNEVAFQMTEHGVFQVWDGSAVVWELESKFTTIQPSARCLNNNPIMDCPYLHLRARGGNIVLNWIGDGWMARKVHRSYPGLFPADFQ